MERISVQLFHKNPEIGDFNRESNLFVDFGPMAAYFICSLIGIFILVMGQEFIYECNLNIKSIESTSYIFVIDESGSMSGNNPGGLRYEAPGYSIWLSQDFIFNNYRDGYWKPDASGIHGGLQHSNIPRQNKLLGIDLLPTWLYAE